MRKNSLYLHPNHASYHCSNVLLNVEMKTIARVFLLSLIIFCTSALSLAQSRQLVVWQKDGSNVYYDLSEQPQTTFSSEGVVISTKQLSITYPMSRIAKYTYDKNANDIVNVGDGHGMSVKQLGNNIHVRNFDKETLVKIYSIDGVTRDNIMIGKGEEYVIRLDAYSDNILIIMINGITYKMIKA